MRCGIVGMRTCSVEANQGITPTIAHVPTGIVHGHPLEEATIEKVPPEGAMRPHHRTLNRQQVPRSASRFLQEHLPLRDYKRSVTVTTLWAVLLVTAAEVSSHHATCQWLDGLPAEETVRKAVYASLPDYAELRRRLNLALAGRLPKALRRRRQRLALDLTWIPYHGEHFRDRQEVYRSKAKDGTSHFHAYATAYVVHRGERFTVALLPGGAGRVAGRGGQGVAATEPFGRGQSRAGAVGPGVLCGGRDPLPPSRAAAVPEAREAHGPQGRSPEGPERHPGVRGREAVRVVRAHGDRRGADRPGGDLRVLPQLPGPVEAARPPSPGRRVLGCHGPLVRLGAGDVPGAVRDRVELPTAEPGAGSHVDPPAGAAAAVCRVVAGAPQRVGVAALGGALHAAPRRAGDPTGAAATARDVAMAASGD